MTSYHKRRLNTFITGLTVFSLVFNLALPLSTFVTHAQEATAEPAPEATPADETLPPTDLPPEATETPTQPPATDVPPVVTDIPTPPPDQPPAAFADNFQDGSTDGWLLTPGWAVVDDGGNRFLTTAEAGQTAAVNGLILADFALSARLRLETGQTASVAFRADAESYTITLDAAGTATLYRGAALLAAGAAQPALADGAPALWHTLNVQAYGGLIAVTVNGTPQIALTDAEPLPAGLLVFGAPTGGLSLDEVTIIPLAEPFELPEVPAVPTAVVETTPETTPLPEITPEATLEPEITAEPTPETTLEPVEQLILSADFEGELNGWTIVNDASIVPETETNHVLQLAAGGTLLPADVLYLADFRLETRFMILEAADGAPSGVSLAFRSRDGQSYVLAVEANQTVLYRSDGAGLVLLTSAAAPHALNAWHTLVLTVQDDQITAAVNGLPELDYTDAAPLFNGALALVASSAALLDDIAVYDLMPGGWLASVTPTPVPLTLGDDEKAKLAPVLVPLVERYLAGDEAGARQKGQEAFLLMDDHLRISVTLWAADGLTGAALAPLVQAVGGEIGFISEYNVEALVPLGAFIALINTDEVAAIRPVAQATSTGTVSAPAAAPSGTAITEGFDILGVNDWHAASVRGAGVKIAIIDTGYAGIAAVSTAELPTTCLPSRTVNNAAGLPAGVGDTNHGVRVAEVLCDLAPNAAITLHRAVTASQVANRISAARSAGSQIILITMDAGVDAAPGDGTEGLTTTGSMYDQITAARGEGRLVIVSAGNNTGRLASFNYAGGNTTVNITASRGDLVNVSWDDWNTTGTTKDLTMSLEHAALYSQPRLSTQAPAHQFTINDTCGTDQDPTCAAALVISGVAFGPAYVQVQVTGSGKINSVTGSATNINTTSTLGRPADSPDAFTVGAVCADPDYGFPILADSSQGPVFGSGGTAPGTGPFTTRAAFKPNIVAPSSVTTSQGEQSEEGCDPDAEGNVGFMGTSAAAAHAAGMAALLLSNNNAGINAKTNQQVMDYMQSHAVDWYNARVPANEANGFDMTSGAGMPVLGNPAPDYPITNSITSAAGLICSTGTLRFVDPRKLDATFDGTYGTSLTNPYIHPGHAVAAASAGDCVILMPGEYVTPVNILAGQVASNVQLRSYDSAFNRGRPVDATLTPDSVFWVNLGGYDGNGNGAGGLFVTASNVTIDGLVFRGATQYTTTLTAPVGVDVAGSTGATLRNNFFTRFIGGKPVRVDPYQGLGSQGVIVEFNTFSANNANGGAALGVFGDQGGSFASGGSQPIIVQHNIFKANSSNSAAGIFEPTVFINNGVVNLYNNRFIDNTTASVIRIRNTNISFTVQAFGNAFTNNKNSGPVVHLDPGPRFRFINNTVGGSTAMIPDDYGNVITRGTENNLGGINLWEIHNNLFYNNTAAALIKDFAEVKCSSITNDFGSDDGAQNNWAWKSGVSAGVCQNPLGGFNNRVESGPTPWFTVLAAALDPTDPVPDDPYQLIQSNPPGPNDGVDDGDNSLSDGTIGGGSTPLSDRDALNRNRIENITIDIGAYEYRAISAGNPAPVIIEDTTDANLLSFPLEASGGFPPYTYAIDQYPTLYDTNPNSVCGGQPVILKPNPNVPGETLAVYCPPKNLYTDMDGQMPPNGAPPGSAVAFTYHVQDRVRNKTQTPGTVTVLITPTDDTRLAQPINQFVTVEAEVDTPTPVQFRLRPYVSFNDSFYYSETGEQEDIAPIGTQTNTPGADYPYTYTYAGGYTSVGALGITEGEIQAAIATANATQNSLITLQADQGEKGKVTFNYTVNESTATNTITIEVVSALPYGGLHDDTSFTFNYDNSWSPIYSEANINNTLHQTNVLNATATFKFVGTGFALYMQGAASGGFWELSVDGNTFEWNGSKVVTRGNITCRTTAATGLKTSTVDNSKYISNKQTTAYTVACTRLRPGEAHTVQIRNKTARGVLNIDAIGILSDNSVLLPGFHEVRETQLVPLFFGWDEITDRGTSNGIAMATKDPNTAAVTFTFKGTGFAIGTVLEQARMPAGTSGPKGAQYTICVAPADTGTPERCQSFDNSTGATTTPVWNVFRPFFGFDPKKEHVVTIDITALPAVNGRMVIDSIIVYDRQSAKPLPIGTTEDTDRTAIVYGGGLEDTWVLDTNNTRASGNSLTSIVSTVTKAGPFISFQLPDNASSFSWWRSATTTDAPIVLVCVDRGQLDPADPQTTFCITKELRTTVKPLVTNNPVIVSEADFTGGWGTAWGSGSTHTVEIFSLTNQPFNLDRLQVLSDSAPLQASYYEQTIPNLKYFDDTPPDGLSMTHVANSRASGGSVAVIREQNEGVFFHFTGTGFSALFSLDRYANNVRLCWLKDAAQTLTVNDVNQVITTGECRTFNNYSAAAVYQAARTIAGLENTTYAAVIQHIGTDYKVTGTVISGHTMQLDAVQVHGDQWASLAELTPGTRYETSYTNRASDNRFSYLRGPWVSFSGAAARNYSGQNYDQTKAFGSALVFRTNGGDTVRLYRDLRAGYTPLRLCHAPYTGGALDYSLFDCADIRNDGGTAFQSAFNVYLGGTGPHVISITTLTNGTFNLDAVEVLNSTPPLTAGIYPETDPRLIYSPLNSLTAGWRNLVHTSYVDRAAMQSTAPGAAVQFRFTGTGFSLFTLLDSTSSSNLVAALDGTGGNDYPGIPLSSSSARLYYGHAHSTTGLPFDTYTVTITDPAPAPDKFTVDGVQIYGAFEVTLPPGIYDNTAPGLVYGPSNAAWTAAQGSAAAGMLNLSKHTTNRQGGTLTFAVTGATAITLHHLGSTTTKIEVCATPAAAPGSRTCSTDAGLNNLVGDANTTFELGPVGNYQVSITNLSPGTNLVVDAIGVLNSTGGVLRPGIYQENSSLLAFSAGWTPTFLTEASATDKRVKGTTVGASNQTLDFTFNGAGFSIVLVESTTTSSSYTLLVNGSPVTLPNPANSATTAARAPFALTYVGFAAGDHTVRLTNTDSTKPLLVDRVDILGDVDSITSDVTGNIENTDARIAYFPHFSFLPAAAAAASGGSQHVSSLRGAVVYARLDASAFEYVREVKSSYGQVTACAGASGSPSTTCATATPSTFGNNLPPVGFQQSQPVTLTGSGVRWIILRNGDGKPMPLDFLRPINTTAALTKGYYEDTFAAVHTRFNFDASFSEAAVASASGRTVQQTTTENAAALFEFNGTGFSVYFTFDSKADAVKLCWASGLGLSLAQTQAGQCATYDNQSAAARYRAARTILGLPDGNYTASVQMLADNGEPAPHTGTGLPITMQIDAIEIHDDGDPANVLGALGSRYETSYANRAAEDRFLYYGTGWRSVSGTAAARFSGQNYDTIANSIGAGVVFQTTNADSIILYRDTSASMPPVEVCSQRVDNGNRACTTVSNRTGTGVQPVSVTLVDAGYTGARRVSVVVLDAGTFSLDAFELGSSTAPLQPGFYEEIHPRLHYLNGTITPPEVAWTTVAGASFSGKQARWTNDEEATLEFSFTNATGFEVGAVADLYGGEMEICYRAGNNNWADTANNRCYVYDNESTRTSYTTSRTVTGLNTATTYFVRVANEDEKYPDTPPLRNPRYAPARLVIDYVQIFGAALPPAITESGMFNEDAASGGAKYLQLLPDNRWGAFSGTAAKAFSGSSYVGVVDNAKRISSQYAGPVATLRLNKPGTPATVILYTGAAATTNAAEVLACANHVTGTDCVKITTLRTANQIVLTSADLPALANPNDLLLSFRALTPGFFRIDGFQVIYGTTLAPGIYDNFLAAPGGLLNINAAAPVWNTFKSARAYGGWVIRTQTLDATMKFDFDGTGFSVLTQADRLGADMRLCYAVKAGFDGTFDGFVNGNPGQPAANEICQTVTTNTLTTGAVTWALRNGDRPNPATAYQYGFAVHGLPPAVYTAEVRHVDTTRIPATGTRTDWLQLDAIVIFGTASTVLGPQQMHDDTSAGIVYSPASFWTLLSARTGPSRGPWERTEHTTTAVGAIAQLRVQGNALVLYQTAGARTRKARLCLTTSEGQECTDFSQAARTTYFTPIAFYGFGKGTTHDLVIENWDYNRALSIDAFQVLP